VIETEGHMMVPENREWDVVVNEACINMQIQPTRRGLSRVLYERRNHAP